MNYVVDLVQRQMLITDTISRINNCLAASKAAEAQHLTTRLFVELQPDILPNFPDDMTIVPTGLFGRIMYVIRFWKYLWIDHSCRMKPSNERLEKI